MKSPTDSPISRRSLLRLIGVAAVTGAMYETMTAMGYAGTSDFSGPVKLSGDVKGASVLILGAGLAGLTAAFELRNAGYKVQVLEYNDRPGGRSWSLYGGDTYTDIGGQTQRVKFDQGLYFNPGPWRIPYHHSAMLYYCNLFNVVLEPFTQVNFNAYVQSDKAFGGQPKRFREIDSDFNGYVAELLAKATSQEKLDQAFSQDEKDGLLQMLRSWGALNENYEYKKSDEAADRRGYDILPGGGLAPLPIVSDPLPMKQLFSSGMWSSILGGKGFDFQTQLFQPANGMGSIGKAFAQRLEGLIRYNCKVTEIRQDDRSVTVTYADAKSKAPPQTVRADWCVCTIPASILGQIPMNVGAPMRNAINSLSYTASVKVGLQFARRFWEEDDGIFGGITYTDQPFFNIAYPTSGFFKKGPSILLGAYAIAQSLKTYGFEALSYDEQIEAALEHGSKIHPQYRKEYQNGVSIAWHRVPGAMGCSGNWTDENRRRHYDNMCAIDGQIVLAGEHVSRLPAWQEGAVLSSLNAITRLHQRVLAA
jgi:monoamine oxidase